MAQRSSILRRMVAAFEVGEHGAPLAVRPQVAGPATLGVGFRRGRGGGEAGQALVPRLGEARRPQVQAEGGVLDEAAEAHPAVGVDMEIAPPGETVRVEAAGRGGSARRGRVRLQGRGSSGRRRRRARRPGPGRASRRGCPRFSDRVAGRREVEPGRAEPPARAPGLGQADHRLVFVDVRLHGDDLDREGRARLPGDRRRPAAGASKEPGFRVTASWTAAVAP